MATSLFVNSEWSGCSAGDLVFIGDDMYIFGTDAFADIQSAVNEADTNNSTINVLAGTYAGNVTLTKAGIGKDKTNTNMTIQAYGDGPVNVTGTFQIGAQDSGTPEKPAGWQGGLTIEGINFDSTNNTSLQMTYAYNVTVKDCSFNGAVGNYMVNTTNNASGSGNILFTGCEFGTGYVQVYRANISSGRGIEFNDCDFDESTVNVQGGAKVEFNDCDFSKTLTDYYAAHSFYVIRSNATGITVNGGTINVKSTASASTVPEPANNWAVLWERKKTTDPKTGADTTPPWTVTGLTVNYDANAKANSHLLFNNNDITDGANQTDRITFENLTTGATSAATVADLLANTSGYAIVETADSATIYNDGVKKASTSDTSLYANGAWTGSSVGTPIDIGSGETAKTVYYGFNAYSAIDDARKVIKPGVETTINLSGNLDGTANFNWGQNVVLTGTAAINWKSDWLFVGRGGTGTDRNAVTTLTIKDATISSINPSTGFSSTGFHVSGYNTGSGNTNYGKLVIEDSTMTCDYLINRNLVDIIGSTATFVNMYIHGRKASESKSGTDETATLTIKDSTTKKDVKGNFISSTVTLTHINGMDLGVESYGVINVQDASSFNITATDDWTITTKGTVNLTDTATFTAAKGVVNNGAINLTAGNLITANSISGSGAITIDATGLAANSTVKVIDITGEGGFDATKVTVTGQGVRKLQGKDGDVYVTNVSVGNVYVNTDWTTASIGQEVGGEGSGKFYGINAFSTMQNATAAVNANGSGTINIDKIAVSALDVNSKFTAAGNYKITGGNTTDAPAMALYLNGEETFTVENAIFTTGKIRAGKTDAEVYVHSNLTIKDSIIGAVAKDGAGGGWETFYDTSISVSNSIWGAWLADATYYANVTTMPRSASAVKAATGYKYLPYGGGLQGQNFGTLRDATITNSTMATGFFDVRGRGLITLDNSLVYVGGSMSAGSGIGGGNWTWGNDYTPVDGYREGEVATITVGNGSIIRNVGYGNGNEGKGIQIGTSGVAGAINVTNGSQVLMAVDGVDKESEDIKITLGSLNITDNSEVTGRNITNDGTITVDGTSTITATNAFANNGALYITVGGTVTAKSFTNGGMITIDVTGISGSAADVITVTSETGSAIDKNGVTLIGTDADKFAVILKDNGGVSVARVGEDVYIWDGCAGLATGTPVTVNGTEAHVGIDAFATLDKALTTVGKTIYFKSGDAPELAITGNLNGSSLLKASDAEGDVTVAMGSSVSAADNMLTGDLTIGEGVTFVATKLVHRNTTKETTITVDGTFQAVSNAYLYAGKMIVNGSLTGDDVFLNGNGGTYVLNVNGGATATEQVDVTSLRIGAAATAKFTNTIVKATTLNVTAATGEVNVSNTTINGNVSNKGTINADKATINGNVSNEGTINADKATINGNVSNEGTITIDAASSFAATGIENYGTIALDAVSTVTANAITFGANGSINLTIVASELTETTYKLIDITGTDALDTTKITVNGTDAFVDGATYGDYTLKLWDGDVMLFKTPDVDTTNLYVNADWTDYHYAQLIDGTTDKYYGINAFQKMEDVTGKILTDGSDTTVHILSNLTPAAKLEFQYGNGKVSFVKDGDEPVSVAFANTGDFAFAQEEPKATATITIGEGVTFSTYDNSSDFSVWYGPSLSVYGTISGGQNWGSLYVFNGEHVVHTTGTIGTGRIHSRRCSMTINGIEVVEGVEKRRYAADVAVADRSTDAQAHVNYLFLPSGTFTASDTYITVGNLTGHGIYDTNQGTVQDSGMQSSFTLTNTKLETYLVALSKTDTVFNATDSVIIVTKTFSNAGIFKVVDSTLTVGTTLTNTGSFTVSGTSLLTIGALTGTITVDGNANLTGSSVVGGSIAVAAGRVLTVGDTTATATSFGAITNAGTIDIEGASVNLGAITNDGTINMDWNDKLTFSGYDGTGLVNINMTGYVSTASGTVMDYTGDGAMDAGKYMAMTGMDATEFNKYFTVSNNDLVLKISIVVPTDAYPVDQVTKAVADAKEFGENLTLKDAQYTAEAVGSKFLELDDVNTMVYGGTFDVHVNGGTIVVLDDEDDSGKIGTKTAPVNTSVTIKAGTFNKTVTGADRFNLGASIIRYGNSELTINGGTFNSVVAGGMLYAQTTSGSAKIRGDVTLTINGGSFTDFVYGGSFAGKKLMASCTSIDELATGTGGNVTIAIDATNAGENGISFGKDLVLGSHGYGKVKNDAKLIFSGTGTITVTGQIWGSSSGDYYIIKDDGTRKIETSIEGDRLLSFTGFEGNLVCDRIRGFESFAATGSNFDLSDAVSLSDIHNWEIGDSTIGGAFTSDFTGDKLTLTSHTSGVIFEDVSKFQLTKTEGDVTTSLFAAVQYKVADNDFVAMNFDGASEWASADNKYRLYLANNADTGKTEMRFDIA